MTEAEIMEGILNENLTKEERSNTSLVFIRTIRNIEKNINKNNAKLRSVYIDLDKGKEVDEAIRDHLNDLINNKIKKAYSNMNKNVIELDSVSFKFNYLLFLNCFLNNVLKNSD